MSQFRSRPVWPTPLVACLVVGGLLTGAGASAQAAELRISLQDAESGAPPANAVVEVLLP